MGAWRVREHCSTKGEHAGEEASEVFEGVTRNKLSASIHFGISDIEEVARWCYISEVIKYRICRAKVYGIHISGLVRTLGEGGNHTQVTSFGVCTAREEPLLEQILIPAIRERANRDRI